MTAYLDVDAFKLRAVIPPGSVDEIEAEQPGWTLQKLSDNTAWIDGRLRKRYAVPFPTAPDAVKRWLTDITTLDVMIRRGVDPTDQQYRTIEKRSDDARAEVREAADGQVGLFDLPSSAGSSSSGVSRGGPLVYSEQSPYVWTDGQSRVGSGEDYNRGGTGG